MCVLYVYTYIHTIYLDNTNQRASSTSAKWTSQISVSGFSIYICLDIHVSLSLDICIYIYIWVYLSLYICTYIYMYIYREREIYRERDVYIYVYIYIYICIHTHLPSISRAPGDCEVDLPDLGQRILEPFLQSPDFGLKARESGRWYEE